MLGNQFAVDGIPVNVFFVPVPFFLFTEQNGQCGRIFFGRDYQNTVILFQYLSEVGMLTVPSRQSREMTNLG